MSYFEDLENLDQIVKRYFLKNSSGEIILPTGLQMFDTLYVDNIGHWWVVSQSTKERKKLESVSLSELYAILCYLDANKHTVACREKLIEFDAVEQKRWLLEPEEIKNGEDVVGMVGVEIVEALEEGEQLRSIIFISPDGTYSTLTMFGSGDFGEGIAAGEDLLCIANYLSSNYKKLTES